MAYKLIARSVMQDGLEITISTKSYDGDRIQRRTRNIQDTYGMVDQDYEILLRSQGGGCAICNENSQRSWC